MRKVGIEERRARLGIRHLLSHPGESPEGVAAALVALHSSDPVTVYLSLWARLPGVTVDQVERALYEDRSLVRFHGMRRTLWVVDREMLPVLHHSTTVRIGAQERASNTRLIERAGVADDGKAWLDRYLPLVLGVLAERGPTLGRQLTKAVPGLEGKITVTNKAGRVTGSIGMTTRALAQLGLESKVVRGRPAGSWISGQYRWAVIGDWLGGPLPEMEEAEASARLVERWLLAFGPATETDLRWWTGWPVSQVRRALVDVAALEVELDEGVGLAHPADLEPVEPPPTWAALLPSLDPTTMGWKRRGWYLGDWEPLLFDRAGNAGQTVWVDGRVVGGWAQRRDGEIAYRLFEDVGAEAAAMVEARAADLASWLGETRFTPRFVSPLHRGLIDG